MQTSPVQLQSMFCKLEVEIWTAKKFKLPFCCFYSFFQRGHVSEKVEKEDSLEEQ